VKKLLYLALAAIAITVVGFGAPAVAAKKDSVKTSVQATYKPGKPDDEYSEAAGKVAGSVTAAKGRCTARRKVVVVNGKEKIGSGRTDRRGAFKLRVDASPKAKLRVKVKKRTFGNNPKTVCKSARAKAKTQRN